MRRPVNGLEPAPPVLRLTPAPALPTVNHLSLATLGGDP
jgi:hypothetical protein